MSSANTDRIKSQICKDVKALSAKVEELQKEYDRRNFCGRYTNDPVIKGKITDTKAKLDINRYRLKRALWCQQDPSRRYKQYLQEKDGPINNYDEEEAQVS